MSALERVASVAPEYRHVEKIACPEPSLALDDAVLKWYDIAPDDAPVPLAVRALARRKSARREPLGALGELGELGFVVLHRCGESFYFLLVCTWRNENELWETVWAKDGDDDVFFRPWPIEGDAPADVLRVGARRGLPRAAGVDALPLHIARRGSEARVPAGHVLRARLSSRRLGACRRSASSARGRWEARSRMLSSSAARASSRTSRVAASERRELAERAGIELLPDLAAVVREADIVLSVVPPEARDAVAEAVVLGCGRGRSRPLLVDLNAISPETVRRIGALDISRGSS